MARFQVSESVDINHPAKTVYQSVTDISQSTMWRPHVSIMDFSGEPLEVGTTFSEVTKFMGRDMVVNFEVAVFEAGRYCEMKMDGGVVTGNTTWDIRPASADSSTATLSFDGQVSGWIVGLASGLLRNQARKDMQRDLANLKSILESS
jgi:carbon monoxide dehydrogenase subunit G